MSFFQKIFLKNGFSDKMENNSKIIKHVEENYESKLKPTKIIIILPYKHSDF